jgi:hypothetical protein
MEIFFPCRSRNWKGALQQWLVIHLYQCTLLLSLALGFNIYAADLVMSLASAISIPLLFFFTWHFWFALTQRKPIGLPATLCGVLWGVAAIYPIMRGLSMIHSRDDDSWTGWSATLVVLGAPAIGFLGTASRVIEGNWAVVFFVLSVATCSCFWLLKNIWVLTEMYAGRSNEAGHHPHHIIAAILEFAVQLYIGICMLYVGLDEPEDYHIEDGRPEPIPCPRCETPFQIQLVSQFYQIYHTSRVCSNCGYTRPEDSARKRSAAVQSLSVVPEDVFIVSIGKESVCKESVSTASTFC